MKYLLVLFMVSLTLQPLALPACAMADDQQPVQHAAMDHHGDPECCDTDTADPMYDCADAAHCASPSFGFLVIPPAAGTLEPPSGHDYLLADGDSYTGPPAPRLFRPPIA